MKVCHLFSPIRSLLFFGGRGCEALKRRCFKRSLMHSANRRGKRHVWVFVYMLFFFCLFLKSLYSEFSGNERLFLHQEGGEREFVCKRQEQTFVTRVQGAAMCRVQVQQEAPRRRCGPMQDGISW